VEVMDLIAVSALQLKRSGFRRIRNCCQIISCVSLATDRVFTPEE